MRPRSGRRLRSWLVVGGVVVLVLLPAWFWFKGRRGEHPNDPAQAAYSRGDWDRAVRLAQARLRRSPDDPDALRLIARAAARLDQDRRAIAVYSRRDASRLEADDYLLLGRALGRTNQIAAGVEAMTFSRPGRLP